jgi:acyl-coenzyme A thioesterase PaaI-like protein
VDVTQLPFNRLIGLEACPSETGLLVALPGGPEFGNHLGTVHASALLAVAEAASGAFLVRHLRTASNLVPVVRRVEAKFRRPALGRVAARATTSAGEAASWVTELAARGRVLAPVAVEVVDAGEVVVLTATVEWFISIGT